MKTLIFPLIAMWLCNQVIGVPFIIYPVAHVMKNLAGAAEKTAWVAGNMANSVAEGIQTTMHGMKNAFDFEKLDKIDNAIDAVKGGSAVGNGAASGDALKPSGDQAASTKKPKAAIIQEPTETPSGSAESTVTPTTAAPQPTSATSDPTANGANTPTDATSAAPPSANGR